MKPIIFFLFAILQFFSGCKRSNDSEIQELREEVARLKAAKQQLPTATELFDLRAKCAALGEAIMNENIIGKALTQSEVSRYEVKSGDCFVELTVQTADLSAKMTTFHRHLFDGHTKALLASQSIDGDKKTGMVFGKSISGFDEAGEYINKIMTKE